MERQISENYYKMRRVYLSFFCLFNTLLYDHHWTLSKSKNKLESLGHRNPLQVQGVQKVSLQFQKFITKANGKIDKWKLL